MKALNVIEAAYRGTLEEQDDTIVWITHAMKGVGANIDVLLRGNAVSYAVKSQKVDALKFGERQQRHGPDIPRDIAGLLGKGVAVYVLCEDLAERGIDQAELINGLALLTRRDQPTLYNNYDHVWCW